MNGEVGVWVEAAAFGGVAGELAGVGGWGGGDGCGEGRWGVEGQSGVEICGGGVPAEDYWGVVN